MPGIIFLGEKDAAELAALEAELFSLPWSEEQYRQLLAASAAAEAAGVAGSTEAAGSAAAAGSREAAGSATATGAAAEAADPAAAAVPRALAPFQVLGLRGPEGGLAAYISFGLLRAAGELEIYNIATRPQSRRQGLARRLLARALALAAALDFERAVLEVRENNTPALALYRSQGFMACGRRKGYYADTGEDALVLECALHAPCGRVPSANGSGA